LSAKKIDEEEFLVRLMQTMMVLLLAGSGVCVHAQTYPSKAIRFVVPYPPGGGTDVIARPLAAKLSEFLGQQVVVDNRGGANGNIGMEFVARTPPDGYTVVMALNAQLAVNPNLYPRLPYDVVKDYAPVTLLGQAPYLLVVHPLLPAKTVKEFVALVKSRPEQLSFASSGSGSGGHLSAELFDTMAGVKMIHVPYKGAGLALPDLVAGQVQVAFITYTSSGALVRSGRLRAIGVTTLKRSPALPDLPAIAETVPGYDSVVWYGMLAPAGTPKNIVAKLNSEILRVLAAPDFRSRVTTEAVEVLGTTPEHLGDYIKNELTKWAKVVKASGARID
jgi:tripartite-type tricarboxylate transporter receptor subunit TctC